MGCTSMKVSSPQSALPSAADLPPHDPVASLPGEQPSATLFLAPACWWWGLHLTPSPHPFLSSAAPGSLSSSSGPKEPVMTCFHPCGFRLCGGGDGVMSGTVVSLSPLTPKIPTYS